MTISLDRGGRSRYQSTRSGTLKSVPSSPYSLPAPSVRAQVRAAAMTIAGHETWPDASFVHQLPDAERTALLAAGTPLRFEDDQILLVQGDAGDFMYVLTSGLVKVIVAAESGAQTTLAIRSRGDLLGEFALLDNKPRTATACAAGPVTAPKIGAAPFAAITDQSPAAQATVTRYLLSKMRSSTERRAAERVWDARERLAQVLYDLAQCYAEPDADGAITLPLTQGDVGERAGVAVSTAERVLKEFRTVGAVSTRYRQITVRNMAYLGRIRFSAHSR